MAGFSSPNSRVPQTTGALRKLRDRTGKKTQGDARKRRATMNLDFENDGFTERHYAIDDGLIC